MGLTKAKISAKTKSNIEPINQLSEEEIANTFRRWGYLKADLEPYGRIPEFPHRDIDILLTDENKKWREIYCSKLGVEFMHMPYPERCDYLISRLESDLPKVDKEFILQRLLGAEIFEKFLHTRYVGAKRFSLDGLCVAIPLLDSILEQAANHGYEIVMICMAHRGRLNVMHHIADTLIENIVSCFEDVDPKSALGSDDVKYHKGATGIYRTRSGKELFVDLAYNPSHLEAINPVLMGRVRARQERLKEKTKVFGICIHGDAAFAGQGIAAETLNYADIHGFRVGGMVHIVLNNLIGFTAVPEAFNSTRFATDIAKRLNVPIFHVNGGSPEHVAQVGQIALDYKRKFLSDVVIDLIGYRKYGHNEVDDPTVTSPSLYQHIQKLPLDYQVYAKEIGIGEEKIKQFEQSALSLLEQGLEKGRSITKRPSLTAVPDYWEPYCGGAYFKSHERPTAISNSQLEKVGSALTSMPEGFTLNPRLQRPFDQRREMCEGKRLVDYGTAEAIAFGSLLDEGVPVRLVGQDVKRGTFSHRHATIYDSITNKPHTPLKFVSETQARLDVFDSMLSEAAAVGFEYGFSGDYPEALVLWEAQFGDFVNGAQIILDQFISAGEDKWGLLSGLVMLLPHGFEGQGPEHSSARLERFLQSCAEDNMQVCQPSTAAQYFHVLRRQALRAWRKPLILMMPKSMLRAPAASSELELFTSGNFQPVLGDIDNFPDAERLIFATGKVAHDLRAHRKEKNYTHTAIVTIEQLYPLPEDEIIATLKQYSNAKTIIWVQEEPANMGALAYIRPHLDRLSDTRTVKTVRRSASASPATGSAKAHALEQEAIINLAFQSFE